jgi:AraC-like DNA-binding protein
LIVQPQLNAQIIHTLAMAERPAWQSVDPLGEALHFLRMSGAFYCRSEFTSPWGLALPPMEQCLMFHVVTSGSCWLESEHEAPRRLNTGELALVPHGEGHRLTSKPGARAQGLFDLPRELVSDRYEILRHGGGGATTTLICGAVKFDHPAAIQLVSLLPPVIYVESSSTSQRGWIQSTVQLMTAEAQELRPGGDTVIIRLADILVIQAIRAWLDSDAAAKNGWIAALRDKQIGRSIALIHRDPARAWTIESLAKAVAMSRSAFAARFAELVGAPPMQYIARWRMQVAMTMLKDHPGGIGDVAARLGYQSEAAFSRAFKRFNGVAPGAVRR